MSLTETGFVPRTVQEIVSGIESRLKSVFGDSFDVTPSSPDGQIIGVIAQECWEQEQNAFATFQTLSPVLANGVALDYVVDYNNLKRIVNRPCQVMVVLSGTSGTSIPKGSRVGTESGLIFETAYDIFLPATALAICTTLGDFNVNSGEVTKKITSISGWTSVTNTTEGDRGIPYESDAQLRARRDLSIEAQGVHSIGTVQSAVANLGVSFLSVIENDSEVTVDTVPPKSFEVVVRGGEPRQIALAVSRTRPLGIRAFGTETHDVVDSLGQIRKIGFTRPTPKPIYLKVTGIKKQGATNDIIGLVNQALLQHINNLGVGVSVEWSKLFAPISGIPGLSVTNIFVGLAANPTGTVTIPILPRNFAQAKLGSIIVNLEVG